MMILNVIMKSMAATWLHWIEAASLFLKIQLVNGVYFFLHNIRRDENKHLQEVADIRIPASFRYLQSS